MRWNIAVVTSVVTALAVGTALPSVAQAQASFTNLTTPGNLAATQQLPCIDLSEVKNTYTPPDLYAAVKRCVEKGDYDRAVRLFAISGVYAKFDAQRVLDVTARDGGQILVIQTFATVSPEQKTTFRDTLLAVAKDPKAHAALCEQIRQIGAPHYYPKYMVLHGMNAVMGKAADNSALVSPFDAAGAWTSSRASYLKCTD